MSASMASLGRSIPTMPAGAAIVGTLLAVGLPVVDPTPPTQALAGGDFDPGHILNDALFDDASAMSQAEIENFPNAQVGAKAVKASTWVFRQTPADQPNTAALANLGGVGDSCSS